MTLEVKTGTDVKGDIIWNGCDILGNILPSGIYFFRLEGYSTAGKTVSLK
jgi:hypothetical protein